MTGPGRQLTCDQAAARLYEYLDGELTPEVQAAIAEHLKACAHCFGRFEFERAFLEYIARCGGGARASEELRERIRRSLAEPPDASEAR